MLMCVEMSLIVFCVLLCLRRQLAIEGIRFMGCPSVCLCMRILPIVC